MNKLLNDLVTGKDNETGDVIRVLLLLGVIFYVFLATIAAFKGQTWEPVQYGIGFGSVLAGGGAGIAIKKSTEPESKETG